MKKVSCTVMFLFIVLLEIFASTPLEDLIKNKTDDFFRKITLLDQNINDDSYICYYLDNSLDVKIETVEFLIEKGADVNKSDSEGTYPLHFAVIDECIDIVKYLIEKGADVNKADSAGRYPLHIAVLFEYIDIIQILEENGADASKKCKLASLMNKVSYKNYKKSIQIDGSYEITPIVLSLFSPNVKAYDYFNDRINFSDKIPYIDTYTLEKTTMYLYEIPFWTLGREGSIEQMQIIKDLSINHDINKEILYKDHDEKLLAVIFNDTKKMKNLLLTSKTDWDYYLMLSVVIDSRDILDLLIAYEGENYNCTIKEVPVKLDYGFVPNLSYYNKNRYQTTPLFVYALLTGNEDLLLYFIEKGCILIPFNVYYFDQYADDYLFTCKTIIEFIEENNLQDTFKNVITRLNEI